MPDALATVDDLEDMWRPLQPDEVDRASGLLLRASALLRQAAPHVDARITQFNDDPTNVQALDPLLVATVVATIVKRFISNVEGITNRTEGPFSTSYALRGDKDIRGEMIVNAADLDKLKPYLPQRRIGSIRVRPAMAPFPYGDLGSPILASAWIEDTGVGAFPVETPVPIGWPIE